MAKDGSLGGYLGVEASLTGRLWRGPSLELDRRAEALVQDTGLADPIARVLAHRGVGPDAAEAFLAPTLRALLPDPGHMLDCGAASDRLIAATMQGERVAIFADYDVDGAASAALLVAWLRAQKRDATLYVPDRIDEGYGPNAPAIAALAEAHDLIVCVDCGTLSHEALAAAGRADVVVLDHHLGGESLPPALAVVNPNRQDETGDLGHLCAAGVVFLTLVEAGRRLRAAGRPEPNLMDLLDLVALATVADVAPLVGVNRAFVATGLKVMARRARPGLRALADVSGLNECAKADHLGYLLAPRINAGGRIGRADLGAQLLITEDPTEAERLAVDLDRLNAERRAIEGAVTEEARAQVDARGADAPLVWAAGVGWHPGVVGIVAARLKEATGRPAIVIGLDGEGEGALGKGSGRSVPGVDLGAAIQRLAGEGMIMRGGGHRMAAGLTLQAGQIAPAMERLGALLARQGAGTDARRVLEIDGLVMPGAITPETVEMLERAGPFGASAPPPRFALPDMRIGFTKPVGSGHLKLTLDDGLGGRIDAIAFGAFDSPLGPALAKANGQRFHIAGRLELNSWQGRIRPQIRLEDAALAHG